MDQLLSAATWNIILGVLANGLTALIGGSLRKDERQRLSERIERRVNIAKKGEPSLRLVLSKAIDAAANSIEWKKSAKSPRIEEVCLFMMSPEVASIIRQMYSANLLSDEYKSLDMIRREFVASFGLRFDLDPAKANVPGKTLFDAIKKSCESAIKVAIDVGILSAHEAQSNIRYVLIRDELEAVNKNLSLLTASSQPQVSKILAFEQTYRRQVANRHGSVIPPFYSTAKKLPIADVYVPAKFVAMHREMGNEPLVLSTEDFLSNLYRAVILGHPGGGKSTFADKLCYDLAQENAGPKLFNREVTPIHIILRDYASEKRKSNCSILEFIESTANSKYQVKAPTGAFEYLLLNGRAIVVFDGLDELLDSSHRQQITADVESFCNLYPAIPAVVTSREVGYEQAPLNQERFERYRLAPFDDDQVTEYVTNWFESDEDLSKRERRQAVQSFLQQSQVVWDIRSNPLMLALMCNIYKGENYIPQNRPDVYGKCTEMLLVRWDKSKNIQLSIADRKHVKPTLMYLAYWIYSNEELQRGVKEAKLVHEATQYLLTRYFEDAEDAEKEARELVNFCKGRAWVFTDVGSEVYQFTHRTFLEYFTAYYLYRTLHTSTDLCQILLPRIKRREWDTVAQLAFQIQSDLSDGAADDLLTQLIIHSSQSSGDERWNIASFAARSLLFMVPTPRTKREVTAACIDRCLEWGAEQHQNRGRRGALTTRHAEGQSRQPNEIMGALLSVATENRDTVADSLRSKIVEEVKGKKRIRAQLALEIGCYLSGYLEEFSVTRAEELKQYWAEFGRTLKATLFSTYREPISGVAQKHLGTCIAAVLGNGLTVNTLILHHKIESLFHPYELVMFPSHVWLPPASQIMYEFLGGMRTPGKTSPTGKILNEVGSVLLTAPTPWAKTQKFENALPHSIFDKKATKHWNKASRKALNNGTYFGSFGLLAALIECDTRYMDFLKHVENSEHDFFKVLRWSFLSRFRRKDMQQVYNETEGCGFTPAQEEFVAHWIHREVNLIKHPQTRIK